MGRDNNYRKITNKELEAMSPVVKAYNEFIAMCLDMEAKKEVKCTVCSCVITDEKQAATQVCLGCACDCEEEE
jgi:predicted dinucleotide-binding enzyme